MLVFRVTRQTGKTAPFRPLPSLHAQRNFFMTPSDFAPLIQLSRGGLTECVHFGALAVVNARDELQAYVGKPHVDPCLLDARVCGVFDGRKELFILLRCQYLYSVSVLY
jgi:hypothetical protein